MKTNQGGFRGGTHSFKPYSRLVELFVDPLPNSWRRYMFPYDYDAIKPLIYRLQNLKEAKDHLKGTCNFPKPHPKPLALNPKP